MITLPAWIAFTVLAAFMQAIRTAGQKQLTNTISPMSSTLVRYVFGWPFAILYLMFVFESQGTASPLENAMLPRFLLFACLASIAQIAATFFLVKAFSQRNFTVATSLAKTEAIQAAVVGFFVFGLSLSVQGWIAVVIGFLGVFFVSLPVSRQPWNIESIIAGLLSGLAFALTSLWLREASLSLNLPVLLSAATTLAFMVTLQSLICSLYTVLFEKEEIVKVVHQWPLATFVGFTSAAGSIGWFTAMTYENPALVKSLGQIEFIFTFLLTLFFFKEKVNMKELIGVAAVILSVVLIVTQ